MSLYPSGFARSGMCNSRLANARNSTEPTNQSWSNQLLLVILGSCDQGFDFKRVVVQALRGQPIETGDTAENCHHLLTFLKVNQTATGSATNVAGSVQLGLIHHFNIGFENSSSLDQVGMLFPESRTGHLFRPPVLLIGTTVEQEASPGKCVLLSTSEATGRRTKYWAISSGDKSWAVRVDVRDLGGHLDVTRRAHTGTLATWVTSTSSHAHMVSALPLGSLGFLG